MDGTFPTLVLALQSIVANVEWTATSQAPRMLMARHGLVITKVAWEDNARTKNSSVGPCISDMTLQVEGHSMPLMRTANYEDVTWDVPLDKIMLKVGNEHGQPLREVSLQEYLNNFTDYLSKPAAWKPAPTAVRPHALSCEDKGEKATMSAQACLLPLPEGGGEVAFNVAIYNYQSKKERPAVLVLVATDSGTSAQMVVNGPDGRGPQLLYVNDNGRKKSHIACRLKEDRINRGQTTNLDAPMTAEEKLRNAIRIIQVPLRWAPAAAPESTGFSFGPGPVPAPSTGTYFGVPTPSAYGASIVSSFGALFAPKAKGSSFVPEPAAPYHYDQTTKAWGVAKSVPMHTGEESYMEDFFEEDAAKEMPVAETVSVTASGSTGTWSEECAQFPPPVAFKSAPASMKTDVVDAMVSVGKKDEGSFSELGGLTLERDTRWPVRITVQFYKATSNGWINDSVAASVKAQLDEARLFATRIGSLVTDAMEMEEEEPHYELPAWWGAFWEMYGPHYKHLFPKGTKSAADFIFVHGRFCLQPMEMAAPKIIALLDALPPIWTSMV